MHSINLIHTTLNKLCDWKIHLNHLCFNLVCEPIKPHRFYLLHLFLLFTQLIIPYKFSIPSLSNAHHFLSVKLTSKNYLYCKTQLLLYISEGKIFSIIDDSNPCPPSTICVNDTTTPNLPSSLGLIKTSS